MRLAIACIASCALTAGPPGAVAQDRLSFPPGATLFEQGSAAPRSCARMGPGFIAMPGTTSCVRIGGRVTAQTTVGARRISRDRTVGAGASGTVSIDIRTDTPRGPFRTFVRVRAGDPTGRHTQAYIQTP